MTDTTAAAWPATREEFDERYMPPEPDTIVSQLRAANRRLSTLRAQAQTELDAIAADRPAFVSRLIAAAAVAGDDGAVAALLDAGSDPEVAARRAHLERRRDLLSDAAGRAFQRAEEAARSDPAYVAWHGASVRLLTEWRRISDARYDDPAERRRDITVFTAMHAPRADAAAPPSITAPADEDRPTTSGR